MKIATPLSTPTKSLATVASGTSFNGITFTASKSRTFALGLFTDTVTPKYRETLAGKALFEFRNQAVASLDPPFTLSSASIKIATNSDFFKDSNKIITQLYSLKNRLTSFCMHGVFDILPFDANGALAITASTIPLLEKACTISEEHVCSSNKLYAENAAEKLCPQNLAWTQDLLLASCNATLRSDLEHWLVSIPDEEQDGPLVLHMILNQLMSTNHEAARAIVGRLQSLSVRDFPGENINNFCATFDIAVMRLNISGHCPIDIGNIFALRLQTCTVPRFTGILASPEYNDDPILDDYFGLCERVIKKYTDLLLSDRWLPTTTQDSSFNKSESPFSSRKHSPGNTKQSDYSSKSDSSQKLEINTSPPAVGAPTWKANTRNPRRRIWWCAECPNGLSSTSKGRWGNHSTDRHDPNKVNARAKSASSNTMPTTETTTTPNSSPFAIGESEPTTNISLSMTATPDF